MQLGEAIGGPDAGGIIERGSEVRVEEMTACRHQQLVKRPEEPGITAGKQEAVDPRARQRRRRLDERVPRSRNRHARAAQQVAAVVEQPHVEVAGDLQQRAVDPRQFARLRQEVVDLGAELGVERGQPRRLRWRIFRVR